MDRSEHGLRPGRLLLILLSVLASLATGRAVAPQSPGPRSACPVCGMFVAPHPDWLAQVVLDDGTALFFDGCKDLFVFLSDPARFGDALSSGNIAAIFVTGYYDQAALDAHSAVFVAGSDVYGPMGAELVPLHDREEAEEFMRDHHGRAILRFEDIDSEVLAGLR